MTGKHLLVVLLALFIASGVYWNYRSSQAANEARLLEEKARAAKMEAEIERLKNEVNARDDVARARMLEQQQDATAAQQARELEHNRALAEQVTGRNAAEQARFERQQELERQRLEAQRRAEDAQARRQALDSEADAKRRAAQDAQAVQALENERLNARRLQEQDALRQQQQAQQDAQRRLQQQQIDDQRRRAQQGGF
jgi:hypothetical protein